MISVIPSNSKIPTRSYPMTKSLTPLDRFPTAVGDAREILDSVSPRQRYSVESRRLISLGWKRAAKRRALNSNSV